MEGLVLKGFWILRSRLGPTNKWKVPHQCITAASEAAIWRVRKPQMETEVPLNMVQGFDHVHICIYGPPQDPY